MEDPRNCTRTYVVVVIARAQVGFAVRAIFGISAVAQQITVVIRSQEPLRRIF
jgi:hypothetical protein